MKRVVKIPKSRLTAPIDFGAVISTCEANGVKLKKNELDFMIVDGGQIVMFDAYAATHKYKPLNVQCGVICFPFYMTCMTDDGERVAYFGLRFTDDKPIDFLPIIDDVAMLRLTVDPDAAAVPIPSGVCCFSDVKSYEKYRANISDEEHPLSGTIVLNGMTHQIVETLGCKYAVSSTGWGDGVFRPYKGVDVNGRLACIIVDFGIIEMPSADDKDTVDVEVESKESFVYDPKKSESQNNVDRWTLEISNARNNVDLLNAYSRRGYAYHSMGNVDAALVDYISAIKICKKVDDRQVLLRAWSVYDNAAGIYVNRSDYDSAIELMNDALAVRDNLYTGAFVRLIDLYLLTKRTDKAQELALRLLAKRSDNTVAVMKYAETCVAAMDFRNAAETYSTLANKFKLYENLFDEAACLIELGELDKADLALEDYPYKEYNEQYWYYKAYVDFKKRRYSDALKKAEKAHEIDCEYMPALYLLIDIHSIMQSYHAVASYAEEYKRIRPDNEYGYCVCAEAQLLLGNYSECSRNYAYLYEYIKPDEKYAALAAITAEKIGDIGRKKKLLKTLRRKKSPYYSGVLCATYMTSPKNRRNAALSKVVYKLRADGDFLLQLAAYFIKNDCILPATYILDILFTRNKYSFEIVAQQIRAAVRLGDKKLYDRLFAFYVENYAADITDEDKKLLAQRFEGIGKMKGADLVAKKAKEKKSDAPLQLLDPSQNQV